ncbi:GntR family transcriptional regulator (plasmid) [Rhizobium sp. 32-5/1]|uniref:GntR family transcriptional regulator n=1 Tax=Rhizobium sp. 32-5/1 TaxID=3019602 RepID=UPI00240D3CCF|nr:GntR family transcriptional regulator [Rhizobium sp. 32-5/1]WEZ85956.1 GntR family transcriptional regulator [Rhizobium sp. 32-5/1]
MNEIARGQLRQTTYEAIKAMIVTGQLTPGRRLTELELVEQLQVSRTPVREALNRLERDGLVIERPRTGFAVVHFDEAMLRNVFDIRVVLDEHATRLAMARITDDEVDVLRGLVAECERLAAHDPTPRGRLQEMQTGLEIHRSIARYSGNPMLADMLNGLLEKCQVYVWMELTQLNDWQQARDEHHAIVEAIAARDVQKACDEARQHINQSRDGILKMMNLQRDFRDLYKQKSEDVGV